MRFGQSSRLGGGLLAAWLLVVPAHAGEAAPAQSAAPAAASPATASPATASVVIHVRNVSPRGGTLRVGLYDEANYPDDTAPAATADVKAEMGETTVTLSGVRPGTYAVETFQDINDDGKMNTSWLGLPLEPFGFSRDARPHLSKPAFERVKFDVAPGVNTVTLHLQNSTSAVARK